KALVTIAILFLAALAGAADSTSDSALKQYQRTQAENLNQRYFRYDDGAPRKAEDSQLSTYRDGSGFLWIYKSKPVSLHRFNGISFVDYTRNFPSVERDSLKGVKQTPNKTLYLTGKHYVYKWDGRSFTKYAFPKDDTIEHTFTSANKLVCVGRHGYAVQKGKSWRYIRIEIESNRPDYDMVILRLGYGEKKNYPIVTIHYSLDKQDTLYRIEAERMRQYNSVTGETSDIPMLWDKDFSIQCFSATGKYTIPVLNKAQLAELYSKNVLLSPAFYKTANGDDYLVFWDSNLIYKINPKQKQVSQLSYPESAKIHRPIRANDKQDWIVYSDKATLNASEFGNPLTYEPLKAKLPLATPSLSEPIYIKIEEKLHYIKPISVKPTAVPKVYQVYSGLEAFVEVRLPDFPAHKNIDQQVCIDENTIVYCVPDKDIPQVHNIYANDLQSRVRKFQVIDPAPALTVLDYNKQSDIVLLAGKDQLIAVSLTKPSGLVLEIPPAESYERYWSEGNYLLYTNRSAPVLSLYKHSTRGVTLLTRVQDIFISSFDALTNNLSILKENPNNLGYTLSEQNVLTGKTQFVFNQNKPDKFSNHQSNYINLHEDFSYDYHANGKRTTGILTGVKTKLDSLLSGSGLTSAQLFPSINIKLIANDILLFESLNQVIKDGAQGKYLDQSVIYSNGGMHKPIGKFAYTKGSEPRLEIPMFTYNLSTSKLTPQPTWLKRLQITDFKLKANIQYIMQYQSTEEGGKYLCQRFEDGKISPRFDDFLYEFKGDILPEYEWFSHYNSWYFVINKQLHYLYNKQWKFLDIGSFDLHGKLKTISTIKADIWLSYENALVRVSPQTGQSFVFTAKNGVPQNLQKIYQGDDGNLYLLAETGVYSFNPDEIGSILIVPWLQVNNLRYDSKKLSRLKHNQNNVIIPVDVLNTLNPERIRISYRLLGYEEEWKERDYNPQIEYPKLPPGRYEFQIYATSPTGKVAKTISLFFIISAPFYATWWAYLLYIIAIYALGRYLYRIRLNQLKARNLALENKVALRTKELKEWQQHFTE
ncbi:MAG: triple tyrosine motif-containing protein, partial [Candidatus Cloacimonetes bacterium]|nr:triple tyrosine motif-containing protein [Candidatus Cloacimonadota bacterium]